MRLAFDDPPAPDVGAPRGEEATMTRQRTGQDHAVAGGARQRGLAASIDEAAGDIDADGRVPTEEPRRALLEVEAEGAM